jgi:hypothetical protein
MVRWSVSELLDALGQIAFQACPIDPYGATVQALTTRATQGKFSR